MTSGGGVPLFERQAVIRAARRRDLTGRKARTSLTAWAYPELLLVRLRAGHSAIHFGHSCKHDGHDARCLDITPAPLPALTRDVWSDDLGLIQRSATRMNKTDSQADDSKFESGAALEIRTPDLRITSALLCQLS